MNKLILNFALYTFLTMAFSADIYAPKPLSLVFEDAIGRRKLEKVEGEYLEGRQMCME